MKKIILGLVALIIIAGGVVALTHKSSPKSVSNTSQTASSAPAAKASTNQPAPTTPAASSSSPMNVTISANDDSASPETITPSNGQMVNLTFAVSSSGTYHGGLEFNSTDPVIDSGPIATGSSKVVSFTASKSFKFTPYWYASNVQKGYFVTVNVK